jgi:hypothetical protein
MAMICMIILSFVVLGLINWSDTTMRGETALVDKRTQDLAADSAIETAIESFRDDTTRGPAELPCPSTTYYNAELNADVIVECKPHPESFTRKGDAGEPPDSVIVTLGGVKWDQDGQDELDPDADPGIPFCDDFRPSSPKCEPGFWIGGGIGEGGVVVTANGSDSGEPLIRSNSSIILKDGSENRTLKVAGGPITTEVWARRSCDTNQIRVDYDPTNDSSGVNTSPGLMCRQGDSEAGPTRNAPTLKPTDADLWWRHDLWGFTDRASASPGTPNSPGVDRYQPWVANATNPLWIAPSPTNVTMANVNTFLADCDDGYVKFEPGRYTSVVALNMLMTDCPSTFFWFTPGPGPGPGVYYFDFEDVAGGSQHKWREPKNYSQLVAGSRPNTGTAAWRDCICAQPTKSMVSDKMNPDPDLNWPDYRDANYIDGVSAAVQWNNTSADLSKLEQRRPRTRIPDPTEPENSGHSVTSTVNGVKVAIAHTFSNPFSAAWNDDPDNPGSKYPRVVIRDTADGGECRVPLRGGSGPYNIELIDVTNGCKDSLGVTRSSNNDWPANLAVWTPKKVNALKVTYEAKRENNSYTPAASVDGVEIRVDYTGHPTPSWPGANKALYPGGCDPSKRGVQFVFGNLSRIEWQQNDLYAEICASKGTQDKYNIGLYGLTDLSTPLTRIYDSSQRVNLLASTNLGGWSVFTPGTFTAGKDTYEDDDGTYGVASWSDSSNASANVRIPFGTFPANSTLENLQIKVRHAEPTGSALITNLIVRVKQPDGYVDEPDYLGNSTMWVMRMTDSENSVPNTFLTKSATMHTDVYGDEWPEERLLLDELKRASALNGAEIQFEIVANSGAKVVHLDSIEIVADYRPPGSLRPLRGCLTVRSERDPVAMGYVGIDPSRRRTGTDAAYNSGGGNGDPMDCPIMKFWSGSDQEGSKLHIAGSVYAPTAALELNGRDNDAPLVTDGVVVRTLKALRWKKSPSLTTFGGGSVLERDPREVVFEAYLDLNRDGDHADPNERLVSRARVRFPDDLKVPANTKAEIPCWLRRPSATSIGNTGC